MSLEHVIRFPTHSAYSRWGGGGSGLGVAQSLEVSQAWQGRGCQGRWPGPWGSWKEGVSL